MSRAFNLTAEINLRGPANIRTVVADIRRQLGSIDVNINPRISPQTARNITRLNTDLQRLNNTLSSTTNIANNASASLRNLGQSLGSIGANNALQNLNNTVNACQNLGRAAGGAGGNVGGAATQMEEFGRQSALAVRRFAAFSLAAGTISLFTRAVYRGVDAFIAFDKEFVRLQQVTGESAKSLQSLASEISRLSTGLGVASSDLTTVAVTLAQAGLSASDTRKALDALAKSSLAPSFDDMNETVEGSIALMRQFGIGAGDLESALGSINSVAAKFAVEASDIITAIQRTGGVFATASKGVSEGTDALNQFIAVFTSVRQTTRESAETIATGLRTIFTRVQRGGTIEALKEYGVVLTDLEGKFVGPYEAVKRLSEGLSQIDPRDIRFSQIVEELGGFRQIGKVIPLIQQFAVAQQALKVAQTGQASLAEDAATAQLSLANQLTKVREEFTALIRSVGESDSFRSFVTLSLQLASALIKLADSAKTVLPALTAIATIRGASALFQYGAGFGRGLGGGARRFASGGMVPGSGNRDTVPAMLTPGEFVIRKKAVEAIGSNKLHKINKYANGGVVQKFVRGGGVRNVGYIDSDEISGLLKDPIKGPIINAEMKKLGIKGVAEYKEYLSNFAASRRSEGKLQRLTNIFGVAGSGKSSMARGGSRSSQSDNAKLRKTNRFPILTIDDLLKADQVIDTTSVIGPSQNKALSSADRIIALSSRTKESQEILKKQRKFRDVSGINLFGRKPGATKSAPLDSGMGEAYIAASEVSGVDPKKVRTLKIGENFKKTRTNQPTVRSPDRTGLFYGNFGPSTAGHVAAIQQAAKKSGIPLKDFVALISGDTPIDFASADEHSRRTGIFPQKAKSGLPSRFGMATSVFGAVGANVSAMPSGSGPNSIPSAFKIGEDSYIVPKGNNNLALVGDEKDPKVLDKYSRLGYSTMSTPRIGGISGTDARAAIMNNDIGAMKKLLTPEGFKYVQENLAAIQRRPSLLDAILSHLQKGRGSAGRLAMIKEELGKLPSRVSKSTPPEVVSQLEILRKERDSLTSKLGRRPSKLLARLEQFGMMRRRFAGGGAVQRFAQTTAMPESGRVLGRSELVKKLGISATSTSKAGINRYNLLGEKSEKGEKYRRRLNRLANKKQENNNDINGINLNKSFGVSFLEGGVSAISSTIRDVLTRGNQTGAAGLNKFIGNKKIARGARITAPNAKSSTLSQGGKDIFDQSIMNGLPSLFDNAVEQLPEPLKPGRGQVSIDQLISSSAKQAIKGYFFEAFIRRASQNLLKDNDTTDPIFDFTGVGNKQALNRLFGGRFITPNEFKVSPTSENVANAISKAIAISKPKDLQVFAAGGSVSDTVPALLTPGEFVINKKAAKRIGGSRLHQLNKADKIQGFNKGGPVGNIQKFFFGGRPRNVPSGGGWTGNNVTPLSNFGVGGRQQQGMGGATGFIALTAGGVAVDTISNSISDKVTSAVVKSGGSDILNFGAIGATIGSFFGPQGAFIGALLGGAAAVAKSFFGFADTVAQAQKEITKQNLDKAVEQSSLSSLSFTKTLNIPDRTKALKDLQATSILESETFAQEKFNSQSKLGDMLKTQEGAAKSAETILIAEIKRTGKTFNELSTSMDVNDFGLLIQQIGEGTGEYQRALKDKAKELEAAGNNPAEQERINKEYTKKLWDISNEATMLIGLAAQSTARQQVVNQILDNIIDKYNRVGAAIEKFGSEIDNIKNSVLNKIKDFEGGPNIPDINRSGEKVLSNIKGSSNQEINTTANTIQKVIGGEVGKTLGSNLQASKNLIDKLPTILQNADINDPESVGKLIKDNLPNIPPSLIEDVVDSLKEELANPQSKGFKDLANDPQLLSKISKNLEESNKTASEALKEYYDSLQAVTDLQNKYIDTLSRADEYQRKTSEIRLNADLDLKKLYGQNVSLNESNEPFNKNIRDLTGGTTDPNKIAQIIKDAQQEGSKIEEERNKAIADNDQKAIKDSTEAYTKNRLKLKNTTDALKLVADNASRAANALSKIAEKKQRLDNLTNSVEQLLVAGPEEVLNFNQQAQAFAASKNAGADFFKSTKNRQLAFAGLNQIKDLMGEENYRNNRADLVEKSLRATMGDPEKAFKDLNIGMSFKDYIEGIRTGTISDEDPTVKQYKQIVQDTIVANQELSKILRDQAVGIEAGITNILLQLANQLPKIIQEAYDKVNIVVPQQPNQQPKPPVVAAPAAGTTPAAPLATVIPQTTDILETTLGIDPRVGWRPPPATPRASGGIVYASKGQMINFQPKGTDKVPAMLTEGEFVINKDSTKANRGLLEAINNSKTQYASRGGVIYAATGGGMGTSLKPDPEIREANAFFKQYGTGEDSGGPGTASLEEYADDSLFSNQDNLNAILTGKYSMGNVENMPELAKSILQSEMDDKNRQLEYDLYENLSRFEDPKLVKVDDLLSYLGQEHNIFDATTDTDMTDQQKSQAREVATRRIEEMQKKYKFTPEEAEKVKKDYYGNMGQLLRELEISKRAQAETYRQQATGEIAVDAKTKQIAREQVNSIESIKGLKPTDWAYKDKLAENRKKYLERKKAGTVNNTPQTQYHSMLRERKARYNAEMQSRRDNYQNSTGARKQQPMLSKEEKKLKLERIQSLNRSMANAQLPKDREARKLALLNRYGATKRVNYPRAVQSEGRLSERDLSLLREARDEAERDAEVGLTRRKSYDPRGRGTQSPLYTSTGYSGGGKINPANGLYMPGMAGRDDMIAKVGTGEFITNESSTKKYRPLLEAINRSKGGPIPIPGFADGTSSGGGSTKSTSGFNGFSIDLSNESKSSMDKFIIDFGSYVDKLSNISLPTVPDTIEMTGNHVVDVRVTGAAAFESLQDGIKNMIDTKINEKMGEIWTQSGGQLGKAPSLPGKK